MRTNPPRLSNCACAFLITLTSSVVGCSEAEEILLVETLEDCWFFGNVWVKPSAECTLRHWSVRKKCSGMMRFFPSLVYFTLLSFIFRLRLSLVRFTELLGLKIGSTAGIPTNVNKSANMADFSLTSSGLSQFSEGDRFTSSSQGFSWESIKISKPYNSTKGCKHS